MKRKTGLSKKDRPPKNEAKRGASPPAAAAASPRRQTLFRLLAITLVPALALAGLELVLRLLGYGYPTSYFLKTRINGRDVFVENDRFGLRFFPPALARSPAPTILPADKPTNTCRIFILGESAALGDPEPAFGFGRYLEVLLRDRFPETHFEVVCAAATAINSHALLPVARECARHAGDLWVVYLGNNEVVGPFGAGTVWGPRAPGLFLIRASLALKTTRLGQLLDALVDRLAPAPSSPSSWQGMKMFLNSQIRHDDPRRARTNEYFRRNLDEILLAAQKAEVKVVLCTVASNLKDCAPFASLHSRELSEAGRAAWEQLYREGADRETAGKLPEAIDRYAKAAAIDGEFAELQFRLGRCYLGVTNYDQARKCFELALEFDALPFRAADSQLNAIIKEAARRFAGNGVSLLDAREALAQATPQKIAGNELFYEHVHLNFDGNYLLARAVAEKAAELLPASVAGGGQREWASAEACDRRLCVTPWDRYRLYKDILQREAQSPFTLQLNHAEQTRMLSDKLKEISSHMGGGAGKQAGELYRQELSQRPDDFLLHSDFAKLLEETGDLSGAVTEWKRVEELLPYHFGPSFYLGKLHARRRDYPEAERSLTKTLQLRPDVVEAMDELGQILTRQKRTAEALNYFHRALRLQPDNARLYFHVAEALGAEDKRDQAMDNLRKAVQLRPDYWEARYFLGVELAVRGDVQQAREQFSEVVRLKPDYPLAHLNLGVALANQGKFDEALAEFQETLRLDPGNKSAQQRLDGLRQLRSRQH